MQRSGECASTDGAPKRLWRKLFGTTGNHARAGPTDSGAIMAEEVPTKRQAWRTEYMRQAAERQLIDQRSSAAEFEDRKRRARAALESTGPADPAAILAAANKAKTLYDEPVEGWAKEDQAFELAIIAAYAGAFRGTEFVDWKIEFKANPNFYTASLGLKKMSEARGEKVEWIDGDDLYVQGGLLLVTTWLKREAAKFSQEPRPSTANNYLPMSLAMKKANVDTPQAIARHCKTRGRGDTREVLAEDFERYYGSICRSGRKGREPKSVATPPTQPAVPRLLPDCLYKCGNKRCGHEQNLPSDCETCGSPVAPVRRSKRN